MRGAQAEFAAFSKNVFGSYKRTFDQMPRTDASITRTAGLPTLGAFSLARRQPAEGIVGDGCGIECAVCLFLTSSHGTSVYSLGAAGLSGFPSGP